MVETLRIGSPMSTPSLGGGSPSNMAMFSNGYRNRGGADLPQLPLSNLSSSNAQLPRLRRSSSGSELTGSPALRAIRTSRNISAQIEQLAPTHLIEVRKALATLQGAGLQEVTDVSGLHEQVVDKLAATPVAREAKEPEVMLAPALQKGLVFDFTQEVLEDTDAVGKGLVGLRTLRSLRLRFCRCAITDVGGLGKGIRDLSALKELHIDFGGCIGLTNVDELSRGIADLYGMETLYFNFQGCSSLECVKALGEAIAGLSSLKTLTLNFQDCAKLTTDAAVAIGRAVSALPMLSDLDMNVCGSRVRRGVQRPTILEPGPIGITNYMKQLTPKAAAPLTIAT